MIKSLTILIYNEIKVIYGQLITSKNIADFFRTHNILLKAFIRRKFLIKKNYKKSKLNKKQLLLKKKSDTLFIFGSGSSLNKLSKIERSKINNYDTLGFNESFLYKHINFTYHIHRGGTSKPGAIFSAKNYCRYFVNKIKKNKKLKKTIFLFPAGYVADFTNLIIGYGILPLNLKFFLYITNRKKKFPSDKFETGLTHLAGNLCTAINFGYLMGYKKIVLVGVDLYDSRYFFCPPNTTKHWDEKLNDWSFKKITDKGRKYTDNHSTIKNKILIIIKEWSFYFKKRNVSLEVYNKKSLLNKHIKVFNWKSSR